MLADGDKRLESEEEVSAEKANSFGSPSRKVFKYQISFSNTRRRSIRSLSSLCIKSEQTTSRDVTPTRKRFSRSSESYQRKSPTNNGPHDNLVLNRPATQRFDTARTIVQPKETEEPEQVYEVMDRTPHRETQTNYDVFNYIRKQEFHRASKGFVHLQPCSMRPFGSQCAQFPSINDTRPKIVYPIVAQSVVRACRSEEAAQYAEVKARKEYPGYEDSKQIAVYEKPSKTEIVSKKNYSTVCLRKEPVKKFPIAFVTRESKHKLSMYTTKPSASTITTKLMRKNGNNDQKKKYCEYFLARYARPSNTNIQNRNYNTETFSLKLSKPLLTDKIPKVEQHAGKKYTTDTADPTAASPDCCGYVTVKLRELKEHCRKEKCCKAKKIKFGKLPALKTPNCPCIEDIPLKEGQPLLRLKARSTPIDPGNDCPNPNPCPPRADANYQIKKKKLPQIEVQDCPCIETQMVDFKIKRLVKRKPDQPRICPIMDICAETPRADAGMKAKKKTLPKLPVGNCPCIEPEEIKEGTPLARLKPKKVAFHRICLDPKPCSEPRADDTYKIKPKVLPKLKALCQCIEAPPICDVPPLKRLCKRRVDPPPRDCYIPKCEDNPRADQTKKFEKKKLPVFKPQNCPCIEDYMPTKDVKLKRLEIINKPKDVSNDCPNPNPCPPRADDNYKIKPKKLRQIKEVDCPCVEIVLEDIKPLKRLCKRPVDPPPRLCIEPKCEDNPRADNNRKVKPKVLPPVPCSPCPCIEEEPLKDSPPLPKLKKRKVKPPVCIPPPPPCSDPRADDTLKVKKKVLPRLEASNCPCIDPPIPEDVKPLKRLPKIDIPDKPRIPPPDECDLIPRSDADDWMYWKRCTVAIECAPCPPEREPRENTLKINDPNLPETTSKRSFSTSSTQYAAPGALKYEVVHLEETNRAYSIYVDVNAPSNSYAREMKATERNMDEGMAILRVNSRGQVTNQSSTDVRYHSTTNANLNAKTKSDCPCECPREENYLQPKNQVSKPVEKFLMYPDERAVYIATVKSKNFCRTRPDDEEECERPDPACKKTLQECENVCKYDAVADEPASHKCSKIATRQLSLWERILAYFRARDCPSPEEFRKIRLREDAEKAASKAGLCLYDPKELLKKSEQDLPKVITAKDDCKK